METKIMSAADARFLERLTPAERERLAAWQAVRGTDPVPCLGGCLYPSTHCHCPPAARAAAQTAVA
jgi:hypothetical protein